MMIWILRVMFYVAACLAAAGMWMRTTDLPDVVLLLPDKAWHAAVYAGLTLLARLGHPRAPLWRVAAGVGVFSAVVELGQGVCEAGRQVEMLDGLANLAGVLAGALLGAMILMTWRQARRRAATRP